MNVKILAALALAAFIVFRLFAVQQMRERELGRFNAGGGSDAHVRRTLDAWFAFLARRFLRDDRATQLFLKDSEMNSRLQAAGLDSASGRGQFVAIQMLCYLSWPVITISAWLNFTRYYATVTTLFSFAFVVLIPHLWLKRKMLYRRELIQRELPLFIDLTNMAASAGWDTTAALEKVIDALAPEYPGHPLFKELRRARWLASSGYTWGESLERVGRKLNDDSVTRVTRALAQAIDKGGDRSGQLGGIAEDAQRSYYSALDKRLAAVPVKALMVTMVLFLTYFTILLAPAAVGISNTTALF